MSKRLPTTLLTLAALAATAASLTGCYERVVSAKGLGAERIETQQPYQQDTEVDRWWYGTKEDRPR